MDIEFQKSSLKVMLIIVLLLVVSYGVSVAGNFVIEPLTKELVDGVAGTPVFDCLKEMNADQMKAALEVSNDNHVLKEKETKINVMKVGVFVCQIGLLYLFSCLIVRVAKKTKSNQQRNTDSGANAPSPVR